MSDLILWAIAIIGLYLAIDARLRINHMAKKLSDEFDLNNRKHKEHYEIIFDHDERIGKLEHKHKANRSV